MKKVVGENLENTEHKNAILKELEQEFKQEEIPIGKPCNLKNVETKRLKILQNVLLKNNDTDFAGTNSSSSVSQKLNKKYVDNNMNLTSANEIYVTDQNIDMIDFDDANLQDSEDKENYPAVANANISPEALNKEYADDNTSIVSATESSCSDPYTDDSIADPDFIPDEESRVSCSNVSLGINILTKNIFSYVMDVQVLVDINEIILLQDSNNFLMPGKATVQNSESICDPDDEVSGPISYQENIVVELRNEGEVSIF